MKGNFDDIYYPKNIKDILYKNVDEKMVDHIRRANKYYLNDVAQTLYDEEATYGELFANIERYAKTLRKYGIQKGDCVTLAMPNIPETIYYFYACNEIGATAYLIDPRSSFNNMVECIKNSNSKLFICEMINYYDKVSSNIDKLPVDNVVVVNPVYMFFEKEELSSSRDYIAMYLYNLKEFYSKIRFGPKNLNKQIDQKQFLKLSKNYEGEYASEYDPDIPAIIVNTSGTSGTGVKGVMHSNKSYNIYTNEAQFVTNHLVRGNTFYGYIPYFSMFGSGVGMHVALSNGVIIKNVPKYGGIKTLNDIIDSKANIMIGTPNMLEKLADMYEIKNVDAKHVKQYIIGGDSISPEKLNNQNKTLMNRGMDCKMVYGYGATECMPVSTYNPDPRSHLGGSAGIVYPMATIKIIDPETMEELDYNQEGEVYVNNPTLMMGYVNNPEETEKVFKKINGKFYYKTGDRGYLVESGHLFITGRYKRIMKRPDCHHVSPIPVENVIKDNPLVADCAVIGITRINGRPGVIPTAFVKLKDNNIEDVKQAVTFIASDAIEKSTNIKETALAYTVVDAIPYTINGKVDYKLLENNVFDNMDYYVVDDSVMNEYFEGMPNLKKIKINKVKNKTLKKL